jgi:hypothetical protein
MGRVMQSRTREFIEVSRGRDCWRDRPSYKVGVGTSTHRWTDFPSIVMPACVPLAAGVETAL